MHYVNSRYYDTFPCHAVLYWAVQWDKMIEETVEMEKKKYSLVFTNMLQGEVAIT